MRLLKWVMLSVVIGVLAACSTAQATLPPPTDAQPTDAPLARSTFIFLWRTG